MTSMEDKSSGILCTLLILRKYSSAQNPLTNGQVISYLEQDYGISITPNTLRKHISRLTVLGFSISTFEENRRGVYLESEEKEYDDEEVKVLIDSVLTSRYIPAGQAKDLIIKLTRLASEDFPKRLDYIEPVDDWNHRDNKAFFWNLACLTDAIAENRMVAFRYNEVTADGKLVQKGKPKNIVQPLAVVCSLRQYYLICRFWNSESILHYRIDRMTNVELTDKIIPKKMQISLNLAQYAAEHQFMYGGPVVPIVLKMPSKLAGHILDHFGHRAKMFAQEDGTMEVHLYDTEEGMRYFALQYGASGCEVISPQSLREQVKEDIKSLARKYQFTPDELV